MEIQKTDYLNFEEIKSLITSDYSHDKSQLICSKLKKYCFVFNDELYELQSNISYKQSPNLKLSIFNKVSLLIQLSHKQLSDVEKDSIELKYGKVVKTIFKNSDIETYYPQLLNGLTKNDVIFNITIGELHFNNGYMDVATKTFKQRDISRHVITKYIQRDYKPSSPKQRQRLLKHVSKVYSKQEDMDCILYYLGSALSWKGTQDQSALFLLGKGSSGKSFIMELTKAVLDCYFVELASDTFAGTGSNINKVLNTYKLDPQILISWVNEPVDKKMNGSLFKVWVDGNLQSTLLYKDGQFNFKHHSRCCITANTMPIIIVESGTTRRIISYTHQSHFTETQSEVDEKNNIYLLDREIIKNIIEEGSLDAWFDILIDYCFNWLSGIKPVYGENFKETKDAIISSSDIFQDFIDSKLKITNNEKDKIGKDSMKNSFLAMYPDKHISTIQVMTSLKDRGLKYNMNMRSDNKIRGCFYGVKFSDREDDDIDDNNYSEVDEVNKELMKKYLELQSKYDLLLDKYNKIPELVFPTKNNNHQEYDYEDNDDMSYVDHYDFKQIFKGSDNTYNMYFNCKKDDIDYIQKLMELNINQNNTIDEKPKKVKKSKSKKQDEDMDLIVSELLGK